MWMHTSEDKTKIYSFNFVRLKFHFNNITNLRASIKYKDTDNHNVGVEMRL